MPLDDTMKLAILEKMGEQLQSLCDTLTCAKPPVMSETTYRQTLRDMGAQLETLKWAYQCAEAAIQEGISP